MEYRQVMKCPKYRKLYAKSYRKELGRLAQGIPGVVDGTNTIFFVDKAGVPAELWKDATYGRVVVKYRPEKGDPYRAPRVEPPRRSPRSATDSLPNGPAQITWIKKPNFCSVAQKAMLSCATVNQLKLSPNNLASRRFPVEMINVVLDE